MADEVVINQSFENLKVVIRAAIDGKDFIAAKRQSEMMLLLYPHAAESHYLSARVKNENEDKSHIQDALTDAERAVELDPKSFIYNYYCGALYFHFKLYEYAVPLLRKSTLMEPDAPLSQLALGECYFEIGKGDLAATHFRNALKLDKTGLNRDMIRYKLAHCLVTSGQAQSANALLKRLIKEKGLYYSQALSELISTSKDKLDSDNGRQVQSAIIHQKDSHADLEILHLALGRLYDNSSNFDKAFEHWAASREIAKSLESKISDHELETAKSKIFYTMMILKMFIKL